MGTVHRRLLAALAAMLLSLPHTVAAGNEFGVAVIIGNKEYADDRFGDVSYAHNDAEAFKRFVTGELGFDVEKVIDLRDATRAQMADVLGAKGNERGQLWQWARPDGSSDIVVFYSGHGMEGKISDGRRPGYLLPVDANKDRAEVNGYPIELLIENLRKVPSRSVTVYLDACFSGVAGKPPAYTSPVSRGADISGVSGVPGFALLTAASGNQEASWDTEARHGLFTEHLLDGLYGAADKDGDGRVTARETKLYLDKEMTWAARRAYAREQDAGLYGDASAVLSFSSVGGWGSRPLLGPPPAAFTVVVEPAEARVRILNIGPPYQPGIELAAGSYDVEVGAPGYVTKTETVVHGSSATVHRMALSPAEDRLRSCAWCPELVEIPAGQFRMGDLAGTGEEDERPVRRVHVPRFALARHETTVGQFRRFVMATGYRTDAERDGGVKGCYTLENSTRNKWDWTRGRSWRSLEYALEEDQPVVCMSWNDAQAYIGWLNERTGGGWRLPSEAEWEYAARAGSETLYHFGDDASRLCDYGNVRDTTKFPSGNKWLEEDRVECEDGAVYPTRVGSYRPNALGLHDMHGNVREWTEDCWNEGYAGAPTDGSAWDSGDCSRHVLRGGSWGDVPSVLRAANRYGITTGFRSSLDGFRVARTLTP